MVCAPHKNARVPVEVAGGQILPGNLGLRLFAEPQHSVRRARGMIGAERLRGGGCSGQRQTALEITKTFGRIRGTNAKGDQPRRVFVHQGDRLAYGGLKGRHLANHVIGRQHQHRGRRIMPGHEQCRQADARRRVALARFGQHGAAGQLGQLLADSLGQHLARGDQAPLGGDQVPQAIERRLQQRPLAQQS